MAKAKKEKGGRIVLVGTYKGDQLAKWRGWYNYPVGNGERGTGKGRVPQPSESVGRDDPIAPLACVNELWLFNGTKDERRYKAEFVGIKTREELIRDYGYLAWERDDLAAKNAKDGRVRSPSAPRTPPPHGTHYALFKTTLLYRHKGEVPADAERVIIRTKDFARSPKVRKQLKAYLESPDRNDPDLAKRLPEIITKLRPDQLRVCEAAVQMDFLSNLDMSKTIDIVRCATRVAHKRSRDARLTCLDFFAGSGLVSAGLSSDFRTVWANDISPKKALVFNANNDAGVLQVCPIENISGKALPSVDLSWGSFPCQDLSLAGDIRGLYASRSGLFWQWLRVMDEMSVRPPVVVAENVIGLVSAAGGAYYVTVHKELAKRGYRVGAVMLDAANWLPQSRKRIFVIGVQDAVDITALTSTRATWCHPEPVVKVAGMVDDWIWWNIPAPKNSKPILDEIVDFDSPCDSEAVQAQKLSLIAPEKIKRMRELSLGCRRAFTGYRRTRNHKQVLEVRTDGMAGCLRTPCGGSSRQIIIIANNGDLRTRLLTVRETARLMGVPETYQIPGSYNDGYMAMGDAVAVPVVEYLSRQLLAPLSKSTKLKGKA